MSDKSIVIDGMAVGKIKRPLIYIGECMSYSHSALKSVFVNKYTRFRFGKIENVCQHWRSAPGQLSLF